MSQSNKPNSKKLKLKKSVVTILSTNNMRNLFAGGLPPLLSKGEDDDTAPGGCTGRPTGTGSVRICKPPDEELFGNRVNDTL